MFDGKYDHLTGVDFEYGSEDCLTTLTKYFDTMENIKVGNDYARWAGWEREGHDFFVDNFRKEGFELLDFPRGDPWGKHMQTSDVMLMSIHSLSDRANSGVPNHCAVWLEPRMMLHHMFGRRSEIIPFKYRNSTTHILRHKDIPLRKKEVEKMDFFDILSPSKREMLENAQRAIE